MRCSERLAEQRDRVLQPLAFRLQLLEPRAELLCHLVERTREQCELVAAVHGHPPVEVAARDRVRRAHEAAYRADDRAALEPGDESDEHERCEQRGQQPPLGTRAC